MGKKLGIAAIIVALLAGLGVGGFFIFRHIADENHKKDIEMAADCARSFEVPAYSSYGSSSWAETLDGTNKHNVEIANSRRAKREECANKYHVTHQEVIDKIGSDNYQPSN